MIRLYYLNLNSFLTDYLFFEEVAYIELRNIGKFKFLFYSYGILQIYYLINIFVAFIIFIINPIVIIIRLCLINN